RNLNADSESGEEIGVLTLKLTHWSNSNLEREREKKKKKMMMMMNQTMFD
ncbi:unnamed protein product, partial [Musa hybrid cultivar]